MPRFFVSPETVRDKFAVLTGEAAAHGKVLRLRRGDTVTLCAGDGMEHTGTVSDVSPDQISVVIHRTDSAVSEPGLRCAVYMALAKSDKLEHVIQKATELGAWEIVAFPSARSVARLEERSSEKKLDRWRKIAASAAEQSGRGIVPRVTLLSSMAAAVERAAKADLPLFLYENEDRLSLRRALPEVFPATASVMTGPEGGFEPEEVALAKTAGMRICTLGPRILRCETAPLCALSALMFAAGELEEIQREG